jgi:lysylphosphatidylglycerol synthetase-like protein (DUF2156 family)
MHWESIVLLVVIALGGVVVVGGYIRGFKGKPGAGDAFWGGVQPKIRPLYVVSMLLSAAGFLAVLYYIFFQLDPPDVVISGRFGFNLFFPIFVLILAPSALWLPLSRIYLEKPTTGKWVAVRVVLFIVGLASIALAWALFALDTDIRSAAFWAAAIGSCWFAFHTFVLDGVVWAALFRRPLKKV